MIVPSGFVDFTFCARVAAGYREQCTSLAFEAVGFDPIDNLQDALDAWQIFIGAIGWNSNSPIRVVARVGTADPSAPLVYESIETTGGSGSSQITQPQVSMLGVKRTALGGRRGRGRMFLPQPIESSVDKTGLLDSTYATNVQTALDELNVDAGGDGVGVPVLLHTDGDTPSDLTSLLLSSRVATQRRRNDRG